MITLHRGNLLEARAEAIVNTVNTVGVMGKGIALQFKQAFPKNFKIYERACKHDEVRIGQMLVVPMLDHPRYIINFPTKRHWRAKSKIEDIEAGLAALVENVRDLGIRSIAVPPLGCGNGGLDWNDVRPLIEAAFAAVPDVEVELYEPTGAPAARSMPVAPKQLKMTAGRAAVVALLKNYLEPGYEASALEIQKLAYFLQEAGQPLKLKFEAHQYGPYAENLNHVLQAMEGQFTRGYGDRNRTPELTLVDGAYEEARQVLDADPELSARLDKVADLIEGFESPYGLELLATAHWVMKAERSVAGYPDAIVRGVREWNERKRRIFKVPHIRTAWERLIEQGWDGGSETPSRAGSAA